MNSEKLSSALDEIKKVFESAKRYEEVDQDDKIEPKKAWDKFISDLLGFWDGHSLLVLSLLENRPANSHKFWGAGEADCPKDIKSSNGELHTLRCKVCGKDNNQQPCTVGPAIQALTQGDNAANENLRSGMKKVMLENQRLRTALGFYADHNHWMSTSENHEPQMLLVAHAGDSVFIHGWDVAQRALAVNHARLGQFIDELFGEQITAVLQKQLR